MRYNEHTKMQRQTTGMPYLLKDKQCIQQITQPRMGKKTQAGVQHLLYQLFIITLAPKVAKLRQQLKMAKCEVSSRKNRQKNR